MDVDRFYLDGAALIAAVHAFAHAHGLVGVARVDHICFKCDSKETFEVMRALLEPEAPFVYQSYISGRRIAVIKLKRAFETDLGPITTLELSDQKPDGSQITGFDHVEIYPTNDTYEALVAHLESRGAPLRKVERPHHTTYDLELNDIHTLKLTREPLFQKIARDEMSV